MRRGNTLLEKDPRVVHKTLEQIVARRRAYRDLRREELRLKDRAYYRANREKVRLRKYELVKKRAEETRKRQCVSPSDLNLFQQNPLLEEERGWADVIVCRFCGWKAKKLSQHLISIHRKDLSTEDGATGKAMLKEYRKRFGYNEKAPLSSAKLREHFSSKWKRSDSRRRHKGKRVSRHRFRPGRAPIQAALKAQKSWGISIQARKRMSAARRHFSRSAGRRKSALGKTVSDWQMAKLRLQGREHSEIARKLDPPLDATSVRGRLHRVGFPPGKSCLFFRGEPITEKLLLAHFEDLKFLRVSKQIVFRTQPQADAPLAAPLSTIGAAKLLGVSKGWIHERVRERSKDQIPHGRSAHGALTFDPADLQRWAIGRHNGKNRYLSTFVVEKELARRIGVGRRRIYEFVVLPGGPRGPRSGKPRKANHPLSKDLATALLASINSLREEFRRQGSSARGGRAKSILPSEQMELQTKYRVLIRELDRMLHWAERQSETINLERIGEWMCEQSRTRTGHLLLFWPSVHEQLPAICEQVRNRVRGNLGSAERAKELICKEYGLSRDQVLRALTST
jgi:hypothetical protein